MKVKPADKLDAKTVKDYRARKIAIDALVKKAEEQVRTLMKRMGDLTVEKAKIDAALKAYAALPPKGRTSRSAP